MKRIYILAVASLLEIVIGMNVPVTISNDTDKVIFVKDFDLKKSSINIWPLTRKVKSGSSLTFSITPVFDKERESFLVKIENSSIKVWWNWIPKKGMGPFVDQDSGNYRIIKTLNSSGEVDLHVLHKNQLKERKISELTQQDLDIQDLTEQTGYTKDEIFSFENGEEITKQ